ncbi:MAG TPA: dTDP-4-dehydrorhamnose reductase [Vicinamibacterales bacterium]|nr:dTDP-4-dehydrorhamnose reductase [Vicinamibacterales bacterium]HPK71212.1 dTDP-4-dehydrorhamnose reductase [Vicinamibacterales bacterium]
MRDASLLRRIFVAGSKGQLGAAFVSRLSREGEVTAVDLDELDLTEPARVRDAVRSSGPSLILNCAAFNDVDGAEARPLEAYRVNAEAAWTLAGLARDLGAVLVHYSSEFVFDGRLDRPYAEDDEPAPQSVYGATKLAGERFAAAAPKHYVLRLSSLYGGHTGRTTVDWFVRQASAGGPVRAFADRTVSPSYVPDVVRATLDLVGRGAPFGLYHCGSPDWCAWADIAGHILAACGRPELLEAVPFAHAPGRAARPRHCAMSSAKLGSVARAPRDWRTALDDYLAGRARA